MDTCHTPRRLKAFTARLALACAPLAAAACPTPAEVAEPLTIVPSDTISPAFDNYAGSR